MKGVVWTIGADLIEKLNDSWRTSFFKERALADPWLSGMIQRVATRPHAFAQQTHDIERLHFSTFWNVWIFHEHENPFIFDLGVLHEVLHTVAFQKKRDWSTSLSLWARGSLAEMEKAVSLRTEVGVYHRWPELREKTFGFPIWADKMNHKSWLEIKGERQRLLDAGKKNCVFEDPEEARIAKYARMNARWNDAWSDHAPTIERAWQKAYRSSTQEEITLFEALWTTDIKEGVPFYTLAKRFGNNLKK